MMPYLFSIHTLPLPVISTFVLCGGSAPNYILINNVISFFVVPAEVVL